MRIIPGLSISYSMSSFSGILSFSLLSCSFSTLPPALFSKPINRKARTLSTRSQSVNPLCRSQSHPAGVLSSCFKSASSFVFLNWHLCPGAPLSLPLFFFLSLPFLSFLLLVCLARSLCCESCLLSVEGFFDKRSLCQPTHQRKSSSSSFSPFHSLSLRAFLLIDSASLHLSPSRLHSAQLQGFKSFGAAKRPTSPLHLPLFSFHLIPHSSSLFMAIFLSLPFSHYLLDLV